MLQRTAQTSNPASKGIELQMDISQRTAPPSSSRRPGTDLDLLQRTAPLSQPESASPILLDFSLLGVVAAVPTITIVARDATGKPVATDTHVGYTACTVF